MNADENLKFKNERKETFLFEKIEKLDKVHKEMSIVVIRHKYGLNKSIIFYIKKNGKKTKCNNSLVQLMLTAYLRKATESHLCMDGR